MTFGITFRRCPIYFLHFWGFTVCQNSAIPSISCSFVVGFTSLLMYSLSSCHKFSIGLRSGDSGGVCHQLIRLFSMYFFAYFDVCLGSLSCMNLWLVGKFLFRNGINILSRIWVYSGAFILPSKMQISVGPFWLIPAQM